MASWLLVRLCCPAAAIPPAHVPLVALDVANKRVRISDGKGDLVLRLSYDGRCLLDRVRIRGRQVIADDAGVFCGIKAGGQWFTTRSGIASPQVDVASNRVVVSGIRFGGRGIRVSETWRFTPEKDRIVWRIDRTYLAEGEVEDTCVPAWDFRDMSTWTGALLGDGGVAWCKMFDAPNASYGVHTGKVTFWSLAHNDGLRIVPVLPFGGAMAVRFSRQPDGKFSLNDDVTAKALVPKHGLSRYLHDRQDVWHAFPVQPGRVSVMFTLRAIDYHKAYDRGLLKGVNGAAVTEICDTIARVGVVDRHIIGSNSYYSDCAVLHEPWLAQLGIAIDDPGYNGNLSETLDFQRRHAIESDGRVKSRWAGTPGDAMPGTYDRFGYYEAQWGYLMDSQPCWVMNVAELFNLTGDLKWLRRQKSACERVLDYMLRRDPDGDGLVEMMTDSEREGRGSDWLDVIWASYENALVNAQMYAALKRWAGLEGLLGDTAQAARYRAAAKKLKRQFNKSTAKGGFWDARDQCYAYWRDKDGSVHGTNLVIPVNFSALGYGLCDRAARRAAVLDRIESLMERERLFFWPLCFFSYAPNEAHPSQYPFPTYENGDIFLAWGELGVRAYAAYQPAIALKYIKNVLGQYAKDGLAFQRYLRRSQTGAGRDILANNANIVVGLYRDLYGIQPQYDRLYLEPHLTAELNGANLNYRLRGRRYRIALKMDDYAVSVNHFTVHARRPFGINVTNRTLEYFEGSSRTPSLAITPPKTGRFVLRIKSWPAAASGLRSWRESSREPGMTVEHVISGLAPNTRYSLLCNGQVEKPLRSDAAGRVQFRFDFLDPTAKSFDLNNGPRQGYDHGKLKR